MLPIYPSHRLAHLGKCLIQVDLALPLVAM